MNIDEYNKHVRKYYTIVEYHSKIQLLIKDEINISKQLRILENGNLNKAFEQQREGSNLHLVFRDQLGTNKLFAYGDHDKANDFVVECIKELKRDKIYIKPEQFLNMIKNVEIINYEDVDILPQAEITETPIEKDSLEDLILRIKKLGDEILGMDVHVLIQPRVKE